MGPGTLCGEGLDPAVIAASAAAARPSGLNQQPKPASVDALRAHLEETKLVEVGDADGTRWTFEIRPAEPALLDPNGEWYAQGLASGDASAFQKRLHQAVLAPSADAMRKILVRGVVSPALTHERREDAVFVDDLVRRDLLARHLYAEIVRVSLAGLIEVMAEKAQAAAEDAAHAQPRPTS